MKFSERWLRTMVDPPLSSGDLQDKLTMAGLEVEDATSAAPPFSNVVVGRIEAVAPHPNADRLRICSVDIGRGAILSIVCGAPNAAAGMKVPCALPGAELPGGPTIRESVVRGVPSQGMLCSAKELGIADDATGLLSLPEGAPVGADVRAVLALDDTLITLKLTPNRADCLSVLGIAREVAAITAAPLHAPAYAAAPVTSDARRRVRVEDTSACPRFVSRVIENIDPTAPTPEWMRERLERCGVRSISAMVDITNYVMLELGQPLHAYDDRELVGDVVVRFAQAEEALTLLNGSVLSLEPDLLLVADEAKPLGLAGIMGGEHSGIGSSTTTVFLEGAYWSPEVIQGKMRRLGFISDAGHRFERGVDPELPPRAVERATTLVLEICGGRAGPLSDIVATLPRRDPVKVCTARITRLLGIALPAENVAEIFSRLKLPYVRDGEIFDVTPPSYRFDLAIEEDFVEEVARLYGYDALPVTASAHGQRMLPDPESTRGPLLFKQRLVTRDWQEIITFSFVDAQTEAALFPDRTRETAPIRVLNPIAAHLDVMRSTLAGGLLEVLRTNLGRREDRVRIFEVGRCFERDEEAGDRQPWRIGGLAYGDALGEQWGLPRRAVDVFDVKADLAALVAPLTLTTRQSAHPALHPGRAAAVDVLGETVGWLGELHPRLLKAYDLERAPVLFELALNSLLAVPVPAARTVANFPRVRRDAAVVIDAGLPAQTLVDALRQASPKHVEAIRVFDTYAGPGIPTGKKSVAILVLMQDTERTLTDPEIDATMASLLAVVSAQFGGILRR